MKQDHVQLFESLSEQWRHGDFSGLIGLLADDATMSGYMPEGVVRFEGRHEVIGYMVEFESQWESYRVEPEAVEALDGGVVLVSGRQIGVGTASGLEISEPVFIVNQVRDGKVIGTHWHVDREKALENAGLAE
jgi:ketosteroid isomerase-like protein